MAIVNFQYCSTIVARRAKLPGRRQGGNAIALHRATMQFPICHFPVTWRVAPRMKIEKFSQKLKTHPGLKGLNFHPYICPITRDLVILHPKYTSFSQVSLKN